MARSTTPPVGTMVRHKETGQQGIVHASSVNSVRVFWPETGKQTQTPIDELTGGFQVNMEVLHEPGNGIHPSLGWGIVRATNTVADRGMVLVEFLETGNRVWLPWQRLKFVRGIKHRFFTGRFEKANAAERLRLRLLSWAIRLWNENTGALATFDIDPLPHQVHLVHHILASGQYNWLIADDVGLGKTIEVGLLLAALRQRGEARRVLLITPAGLTWQWQEELAGKFGLDSFRIYRDDFSIRDTRHWKMYDHVIGSIDRFKQEDDRDLLLQAEPWDLVIVDEAHRLSRRQYGNKLDSSQRYSLLHALRAHTESILLLTGTPHQGKEDSFQALLELLHPEREQEIRMLALNPEILGDMVFRNYKADVTDMHGNFIFHGKTTRQIEVALSPEGRAFDRRLCEYIRQGYAAEKSAGTNKARAIGFVMMVYRKLAASSIAAIRDALIRRQERLRGEQDEVTRQQDDARFQGEAEEQAAGNTPATPFFHGEEALLQRLIDEAVELCKADTKLEAFMKGLVDGILAHHPREKILIFTEYRSTLAWIQAAMARRFGDSAIVTIHGSMNMDERRAVITSFENPDGAQFLLSTEAGGEGINLQHRCHVMVNYDLPWNPMRLVQRTGRLYRYGQSQRVVVFNMHHTDTADDRVLDILYTRLERVAVDMANVQAHEYNEAMHEDILGELTELVDVEDVLEDAVHETVSRTRQRIEEALERARNAAAEQKELFQHAAGFNPDEMRGELTIAAEHLQAFVAGMCAVLDIEILERTHKGLVWQLRLGDTAQRELGVSRQRWGITFDRMIAARRSDLLPMTVDNWFFSHLLKKAVRHDFGGVTAQDNGIDGQAMVAAIMRWQNERGQRTRQELAVINVDDQQIRINPTWVSQWLLRPRQAVHADPPGKQQARDVFEQAERAMDRAVAKRTHEPLLPEQPQWFAGGWHADSASNATSNSVSNDV